MVCGVVPGAAADRRKFDLSKGGWKLGGTSVHMGFDGGQRGRQSLWYSGDADVYPADVHLLCSAAGKCQ